jgi:hypothetical protein
MTENAKRWCVLVPCSKTQTWAVPLNCLAEIVTLHTDALSPPAEVNWRDRAVPILDLGGGDGSPWRSEVRGTGLLAIFLGLKGEGCEYWGLAVRGEGLRVVSLSGEAVEDAPEQIQQHATAAFTFHGVLCQVPDLDSFQRRVAAGQRVA